MVGFERHKQIEEVRENTNAKDNMTKTVGKYGKSVTKALTRDEPRRLEKPSQGDDNQQERENNNNIAPVMGGVHSRPGRLAGAFYLAVNEEADAAWEHISDALKKVSVTDTTFDPDQDYMAYSMKYFQNTYSLARSMLCTIDGADDLLLEINRLEGDGFGFADLFVKEFSEAVGEVCDAPQLVEEDAQIREAREANGAEEFLDLSADVGHEMVEHWLTNLRPDGGIKYDTNRIYEALSSLGWNCQDAANYEVLKDYAADVVTPIFEIFLKQDSVQHIPSVYYGSRILKQFAVEGDLEATNGTVASICAVALRYCDPDADTNSIHKIKTSKESLKLLFETLEIIAPKISTDDEKDEDMVEAMEMFLQKARGLFDNDTAMEVRIGQLTQTLQITIEEELQ